MSNTANVSIPRFARETNHTDAAQLQKYLQLDQKGAVIAEYVWIDASGGTRSKCKVSHAQSIASTFSSSQRQTMETLGGSKR